MSLTREEIRYKPHFTSSHNNPLKWKNRAVLNINPVCAVIQKTGECNYWHRTTIITQAEKAGLPTWPRAWGRHSSLSRNSVRGGWERTAQQPDSKIRVRLGVFGAVKSADRKMSQRNWEMFSKEIRRLSWSTEPTALIRTDCYHHTCTQKQNTAEDTTGLQSLLSSYS